LTGQEIDGRTRPLRTQSLHGRHGELHIADRLEPDDKNPAHPHKITLPKDFGTG
jgi:hypothetical protein